MSKNKVRIALGTMMLMGGLTIPTMQPALALAQVTQPAGIGDQVNLPGAAPVAARHGTKIGQTNANQVIHFTVGVKLRNESQLHSFIQNLYNPNSPQYKRFLTPQQFTEQFGPSQSTIIQVKTFLQSKGLTVNSVSPEGTLIRVSGRVRQIQQAFGVTMNNYRNARGNVYHANAQSPMIPASLVGVINTIVGLDNEPDWHHASVPLRKQGKLDHAKPATVRPHVGSGPAGGYTPNELRSAYDVTPLSNAGYNGSGQNVALFELDGYVESNISTYDNYYSVGSPAPQTKLVDGYSGAAGSGEGEVELDIEVVNAIAPKANVTVYEGPNSNQGVIDTYQQIATDDSTNEISSSWGLSELQSDSSSMNTMDSIFQQMAAQGQSMFAASGDSGAYDGGGSQLAVDSPANDPYVTGVGGTHLTLSSGAYGSESAWSDSSQDEGGGGGLSTVYSQPSWQSGPGVQNGYSNGMREVPDVSADADPNTGYSIYSGGSWVVYGGTSCAAPLWAGMAALSNQYAAANGKGNLGFANPTLYTMFNTTQTYQPYHDVTTGNNLYYPATSGYDMATGIGTPDAYNLVRDINGSSSTGGGGGGGTGGGGTTTELIQNGGFESGSSPWVESSSGGYELVDPTNPHSGSYSAYLAGYDDADDSIYQTVSIPAGATTATLSYWTDVETTETTHSYDFLYVEVRNTSGKVLKTLQTQSDATSTGWADQSFDLSAYAGQTVEIYFEGTNDYSNPTDFFVDDVSLNAN